MEPTCYCDVPVVFQLDFAPISKFCGGKTKHSCTKIQDAKTMQQVGEQSKYMKLFARIFPLDKKHYIVLLLSSKSLSTNIMQTNKTFGKRKSCFFG